MNARGITALALLLVAVGLERTGYYGSRAFLSLDLVRSGESASSAGTFFAVLRLVTVVGILVGGAVAIGLGPRATAAIGAFIAMGGHIALAAGAPIAVGAGLVGFGAGVLRPCPVSAAAELLAWDDRSPARPGPHRFAAVAAFAVLAYSSVNVGGMIGPLIAALVRKSSGFAPAYGMFVGLMLLATIAAGGAALLDLGGKEARKDRDQGPYRAPEPAAPSAPPNVGLALGGLAILLAPEAIYTLASAISEPPMSILSGPNASWIFTINPAVTAFTSVLVFALLLVATLQRSTRPPLLLYGLGLTIFGIGLVFSALVGTDGDAVGVFAIGEAVRGVGEAAMFGVPMAYAAIVVRGRKATFVLAMWLVVGSVMSMIFTPLSAVEVLHSPLSWICALCTIGGGIALLALGRKMHGAFFDPPDASLAP